MNGKSIKQIATELHISKQALWQRMKRHQQILDMLPEHSYMIKRSVFVDETLENSIKTLYNDVDVNIDGNVKNVDVNIDDNVKNVDVNIDDNAKNVDINIDDNVKGVDVNIDDNVKNVDVNTNVDNTNKVNGFDVNIVTANLQKIIDMQQQQLAIKDKQIDELTAMLKQSQEQQTILVQALNATQTLAAIEKKQFFLQAAEQTTEQTENPEVSENTKKGFFQRIFRK